MQDSDELQSSLVKLNVSAVSAFHLFQVLCLRLKNSGLLKTKTPPTGINKGEEESMAEKAKQAQLTGNMCYARTPPPQWSSITHRPMAVSTRLHVLEINELLSELPAWRTESES